MLLTAFATFLCFRSTLAAVALGRAQEHPNHPGQCYDPLTNVIKGIGAKWPMKNGCGRVMCEKMGNALYFSYATCPSVDAAPPCTVVEGNPQIAYPDCCPRVECPSENEINFDDNIDPDQVMMASHPAQVATYDVTLDYDDNYGNFQNYFDNSGFSNVFPLWRDIRGNQKLGIDDEERPNIYSPRK